jgi:shikimate kinase
MKTGNVYLVGFMGTGKSTVGRELARKKKRHFVDLDELIELKEKRSIPDIFSQSGEPYFRRVERQVLKEVSREDAFVVACGGGIVMNEDNIRTMKESGTVICLTASVDAILGRPAGSAQRPLLNVPNPRERIESLLKLRAPYYARADKIIDTSGISIAAVAGEIEAFISRTKPKPDTK